MAAALTLLLIGSLLPGALCGEYKAFIPQTIEVLSGSCVTIPCSFEIPKGQESNLDNTCKAIWRNVAETVVLGSNNPQHTTINGDLTKKECTTTLDNMQSDSDKYFFRLDCKNLKYSFNRVTEVLDISVKADPPRPTLTPSMLKVKEGTSVTLTCSAPAFCSSHPPTLKWTPGLGDGQETLQINQDETKVKTSAVNFTASYHHQGKTMSCTATYNKQDGSTAAADSTSLTADISYSPKDTTVSVHPSGPVPEDSNVTLTCNSIANPAVRNYTWYTTDGGQETVIGTGQVLNIKTSKDNRLFFCKAANDLGAEQSNLTQIDVQFAPQILPSSDCTKAAAQLTCSCRTVGNPSPTLQWYLDGLPVNHSDKIVITNRHLNDSDLRSILTVNEPQERDLFTLICRSWNSLGSASQRFCVNSLGPQTSEQKHDRVTLPIFITTIVALLVLVCALLFVNRAQRTLPESQQAAETSTATTNQLLARGGNEVLITTEEDIYVNTSTLRQVDVSQHATIAKPNANDSEAARKSSKQMNEAGNDVIYSTVNCKTINKKGEESVEMYQPGNFYLEEERRRGNVKREVESEYAQVNFKDKSAINT